MTRPASEDILGLIHQLTAKQFLDILQNGETTVDKDGELTRLTPSAAMMAQIIKFLKDNGIEASPAAKGDMDGLVQALEDEGYDIDNVRVLGGSR